MLHWWRFKRKLSAYSDHSLSAEDFRAVWKHLYHCADCRQEVSGIEDLGCVLRRLPPPSIPSNLIRDIRSRIAAERAWQQRPGWLWRLGNQWGHLALPGSAGLLMAVLFFSLFASHFAVSIPAGADDVPLAMRTPARLRDSRVLEITPRSGDMVVLVLIDQRGRVAGYDIVEGNYTPEELRNLRNSLLFAVFDPAMVFGVPTTDTLILSYHKVDVHG